MLNITCGSVRRYSHATVHDSVSLLVEGSLFQNVTCVRYLQGHVKYSVNPKQDAYCTTVTFEGYDVGGFLLSQCEIREILSVVVKREREVQEIGDEASSH